MCVVWACVYVVVLGLLSFFLHALVELASCGYSYCCTSESFVLVEAGGMSVIGLRAIDAVGGGAARARTQQKRHTCKEADRANGKI